MSCHKKDRVKSNPGLTSLIAIAILSVPVVLTCQQGEYALTNCSVETVTNGLIENGTILIKGELISAVGENLEVPEGYREIDCSGLTVYPGLIDGGGTLGLIEIGSLPETRDNNESGELTPFARGLTAVNPNSESIPVTRVNGVTTAFTAPGGGMLPGTGALIDLFGYNPEWMSVEKAEVMVLNFPSNPRRNRWNRSRNRKNEKSLGEKIERLDELWNRAELYSRIDSARDSGEYRYRVEYVPEIDALVPAVRKEMLVAIEVNGAVEIDSAIAWVNRRNVRAVFTGVKEGWRVADKIAASGIPCIVGTILSMPSRGSDRYDKAYKNSYLLHDAGVTLAFRSNKSSNARNLPFEVGFAVAYGLSREAAIRGMTIEPAKIFGVEDLVGSIEVGKRATLFVANGDPLEPSANIEHLFIRGWSVPVESRHTRLYDEFLDRQP